MTPLHRIDLGAAVLALDLAPGGALAAVVTASAPHVRLLAVEGRRLRPRGAADGSGAPCHDVAFHPGDGSFVALRREGAPGVWDAATGRHLRDLGDPRARGDACLGVAFSADGLHLDTHRAYAERAARIEWAGGREVATRWGRGGALALDPAGEVLAVCDVGEGASTVRLGSWGGADFSLFGAEIVAWLSVGRAAFGPDGAALALFGGGGRAQLRVVDLDAWEACLALDLDEVPEALEDFPWAAPRAMAFTPDGAAVVCGGSGGELVARAWRDGAVVASCAPLGAPVTALAVDAGTGLALVGDAAGGVALVDLGAAHPAQPAGSLARALEARFGRVAPGRVGDDAAYDSLDVG